MFYRSAFILVLGLLLATTLLSCGSEESVEAEQENLFEQPAHFPEAIYTFDNNPVTEKGFLLGKKLFYDPIFSSDGSVACANCHQQATAFADSQQHPLSRGVDDRLGERNAPSLTNLAFHGEYFWDGGVTHLDFVPLNAISSDFELDEDITHLIEKLNADDEYPDLFREAFGVEEVTSPYMLYALSQFVVMMVSDNSRYDQYLLGDNVLTDAELEGLELFEANCSGCHSGVLLSDFSYRNNGLDVVSLDSGRARITEVAADMGKFRVPSLRNVSLTAPYMHDARYETLEEVLEHYRSGIQTSETLDPALEDFIVLTDEEQEKIIAFLETLTDEEFVSDSRFFSSTESL